MRIPLFPLQSLLFPDGRLGLRIFEPRYLDMVKRCHERGEPFGVVALIDGGEVRQRASGSDDGGFVRERFQPVGTLAHIGLFDRPQPGLMQILCRGGQRFRLHSSECLAHGLWMGEAELINEDGAVQVPADLRPAARLLQGLLHRHGLHHAIDQEVSTARAGLDHNFGFARRLQPAQRCVGIMVIKQPGLVFERRQYQI